MPSLGTVFIGLQIYFFSFILFPKWIGTETLLKREKDKTEEKSEDKQSSQVNKQKQKSIRATVESNY